MSGNTLYGTTVSGGSSDYGTVFGLSLVSASEPKPVISVSAANIVLTWPANATGITLQSSTNLASSAVWTTVSTAPVLVNGQNTVTNVIQGPQMFYRLSH